MKCSVFAAIGSPAIRPRRSFGMASCLLPALLTLVLSLSFAAGQVWSQCGSLSAPSTTWSDGNGSWAVAGNWTSGTPNASTNACILNPTSAVVTLDTTGNAIGLELASGNSLNIAGGSLNLASGASFLNGGTLRNTLGANLTNAGALNNNGVGATLYNDSTSTLTNSGTLNNDAYLSNFGALNNSGTLSNASGYLANYGTISNTLGGNLVNAAVFNNTGGTIYNDSSSTLTNSI
jgi:hypothetical protein